VARPRVGIGRWVLLPELFLSCFVPGSVRSRPRSAFNPYHPIPFLRLPFWMLLFVLQAELRFHTFQPP